MTRKRLGEMLLEAGIIDEHKLQAALGHQRKWGGRLGQALVDLKLATEAQIVEALAQKFGYEVVRPETLEQSPQLDAVLRLLPREFAARHNLIPFQADSGTIAVAMADPANIAVVDEIRFRTGRRVRIALAGDREVAEAVRRLYFGDAPAAEPISLDIDESDASPVEAVVEQFGGGSERDFDSFYATGARPAAPRSAPAPGAAEAPAPRPPASPPAPVGLAVPAAARAPAAPAPRSPAGPAGRPPAPAAQAAAAPPRPAPGAAPVRPAPGSPAKPAPAPPAARPAAPAGRAGEPALDLEDAAGGSRPPEEKTQTLELPIEEGEPEGAPRDAWPEAAPGPQGRPEADRTLAVLEAIDRMADGEPVPAEVVKPAQMAAALVRLLIRKGVVSEDEFLEEFRKK